MKALQGEGELVKQFNVELATASKFWVGMALVTTSGLCHISKSLDRCLAKGTSGRLLFGVDLPTPPDAIVALCDIHEQHKANFEVRRFQSGQTFFHPKFSIFQKRSGKLTAIVGSSNLTGGGLSANYETNVSSMIRKFPVSCYVTSKSTLKAHMRDELNNAGSPSIRSFGMREKKPRQWRDKARHLGKPPANVPRKLKGYCFAFTGGIADWPREAKLYPFVKKRGALVAKTAASMAHADCLVHAERMGGRKTTRKLVKARTKNIPIVTEEQFFKLAGVIH